MSGSHSVEGVTSHHSANSLSILYYSARSLIFKMSNLTIECKMHNPDIVCITESWLDPSISNNELALEGYLVVCLDRNRQGGGIVLFIKSCYCTYWPLLSRVTCSHNSFLQINLALLYRPPCFGSESLHELYRFLESCSPSLFRKFALLGDFNVDFLSPTTLLFSVLQLSMDYFLLSQVVPHPTHTTPAGRPTLIDLVLLSSGVARNCQMGVLEKVGRSKIFFVLHALRLILMQSRQRNVDEMKYTIANITMNIIVSLLSQAARMLPSSLRRGWRRGPQHSG